MFNKNDKVIYLGGSYSWNSLNIEKFGEYTVNDIVFGTGMTFVSLKEINFIYDINDFCYPNDKRLRKLKIEQLNNKII